MTAELAKSHAEQEFDKFRVLDDQHFESDFDRMVHAITQQSAQQKGLTELSLTHEV